MGLEAMRQRAAQLDRELASMSPQQRTAVAIRSSRELAAVIAETADVDLADELAAAINDRLDGVSIPTCMAALTAALTHIVAQTAIGENSRLVVVGAISGMLGDMLRALDAFDAAEAEAATATKQ